MTILNDDQARMLEAYCDALTRDRNTPPPGDLDAEFAAVARHLAGHAAPEPEASTLANIRARLFAPQMPDTTHADWHAETWTASPMAMRMPPASPAAPRMRESTSSPRPMVMRAAPSQAAAPPAAAMPPAAVPPPPAVPASPDVTPPAYGAVPQITTPPTIVYGAQTSAPARRSSFPARLAWVLIGTLIAAVAIGILVVFLAKFA